MYGQRASRQFRLTGKVGRSFPGGRAFPFLLVWRRLAGFEVVWIHGECAGLSFRLSGRAGTVGWLFRRARSSSACSCFCRISAVVVRSASARRVHQAGIQRIGEVAGIAAVDERVARLHQRRARVLQEPREITPTVSTEPFGNAPRRTARRVADLIAIPEIARRRSVGCERVHLALQRVGQLPAHEILEVTNGHARRVRITRPTALANAPVCATWARSIVCKCKGIVCNNPALDCVQTYLPCRELHTMQPKTPAPPAKPPSTLQRSNQAPYSAAAKHATAQPESTLQRSLQAPYSAA